MKITLATLASASAQEVFNQVATHLLTQGRVSIVGEGTSEANCMYRHPDGLMCAAGCLISDEEYKPAFESVTWIGLSNKKLIPIEHIDLINTLQQIHDGVEPEFWESRLKQLAIHRELTMPEVTQ